MRRFSLSWVILAAGFFIRFFGGGSRFALGLMLKPMEAAFYRAQKLWAVGQLKRAATRAAPTRATCKLRATVSGR